MEENILNIGIEKEIELSLNYRLIEADIIIGKIQIDKEIEYKK